MNNIARQYADFVVDLKYENIPPDVVQHVKNTILDTIGVGLAGIHTEEWKSTVAAVRQMMPGNEATIWGGGSKSSIMGATLANATSVNTSELEEVTPFGFFTASALLPAAIAVAESKGDIDGKRLIESYVVGSEIVYRIGSAVSFASLRNKGLSPPSHVVPFGATATVAKILDLNSDQVVWALGLAGCQLAGVLPFTATYDMSKRFNNTKVGVYGIIAAYLAKHGFTGSNEIFEAEDGGVLKTYFEEAEASKFTLDLGKKFVTTYNKYRLYPTSHSCHTPLDATLKIVREHDLSHDQIEKVSVDLHSRAYRSVGKLKEPKNLLEAQFSLVYVLAAAIVDKKLTLKQLTLEKLRDPTILKLSKKIGVRPAPEMDKLYKFEPPFKTMPCRVIIKTIEGKDFSELLLWEKGTPVKNPLTDEELYQKYMENATCTLSRDKAEELATTILALEKLKDFREIVHPVSKR